MNKQIDGSVNIKDWTFDQEYIFYLYYKNVFLADKYGKYANKV